MSSSFQGDRSGGCEVGRRVKQVFHAKQLKDVTHARRDGVQDQDSPRGLTSFVAGDQPADTARIEAIGFLHVEKQFAGVHLRSQELDQGIILGLKVREDHIAGALNLKEILLIRLDS
jgi:hypothetical protein